MKKIWIVGAKGHVGTALCNLLDCTKYELLTTDLNVDVTDRDEISLYVRINHPDVIINCAGLTDTSDCEKDIEKAYAINAIGARNLAIEAQNIEAKLIHISTDDVFDLRANKPYNEFDAVNPQNIYGKSKYQGEKFIKELSTRYIIIRSSWVYGTGKDFVNDVLSAIGNQHTFEVPDNRYASPTSAKELAKVIAQFIDHEDCFGIYHAVCKGSCSRYEFAREILKYAKKENDIRLVPVLTENRAYSVLDNMMLRIEKMNEPKEWKEALKEYIEDKERLRNARKHR